MKHKTWFRLVIKAIGVLLIGVSLPQFGTLVVHLATYLLVKNPNLIFGNASWPIQALFYVGGLLQFAFGLYLFFGGKWIVDKAIPSNRPYCPECGYDLRDSKGDRCAECGVVLPHAQTIASESHG